MKLVLGGQARFLFIHSLKAMREGMNLKPCDKPRGKPLEKMSKLYIKYEDQTIVPKGIDILQVI